MNSLEIRNSAWHYYIAKKIGGLEVYDGTTDICSYTKAFLLGCIPLLIFSIVALAVIGGILYPFIIMIGIYLFHMHWKLGINSFVPLISILIVGSLWTINYLKNSIRKRNENKPSLLRQAYHSWKHKYCVKIKIK